MEKKRLYLVVKFLLILIFLEYLKNFKCENILAHYIIKYYHNLFTSIKYIINYKKLFSLYFTENMVKELEENLNMIEEIEGFLKIVRSFPLVSLNFLKRLRVIKGNILESGK